MVKIAIIEGHPDADRKHLCHALADAYAEGALSAGHEIERLEVGALDFALLRSAEDWHRGREGTPDTLRQAQEVVSKADHLFIIYPLWLGTMPALLKGFIEQVFRPGVALGYGEGLPKPLFKGKTARVVVTMGMPALAYRWYFFAHGLKNLQRNILGFVGVKPVRTTLFGMVESASDEKRRGWISEMRALGSRGR